jgi:DNA polymerase III subunit beta
VRVSCLQENLQRGLAHVLRAVATRTALPALSNVLIATDRGRLKIAASDLNIAITTWIGASVEEEGRLAVDARLLADFVNTLPNDVVQLSGDASRFILTVQSGRDKAEINGVDADDFPEIPTVGDDDSALSLDPATLKEMISQVEFAAAADDSRPVLAGVLLRFDADQLILSAADGFRLAVRERSLPQSFSSQLDIIVPARALRELSRLLGEAADPVQLQVTPNQSQLLVKMGDIEFLSRLIEGSFPDFRQIIPKDFTTRVEFSKDALMTAVRRSSFFARDNNDVILLNVHSSDDDLYPGTIEVSATAAERGTSQSFVDAEVSGPELKIAFNARYLTDVLGVLKGGQAFIGMNGANQAGVVRPAGAEDFTNVIMPMVIGAQ